MMKNLANVWQHISQLNLLNFLFGRYFANTHVFDVQLHTICSIRKALYSQRRFSTIQLFNNRFPSTFWINICSSASLVFYNISSTMIKNLDIEVVSNKIEIRGIIRILVTWRFVTFIMTRNHMSCSVLCIFWPLVRRGKCFFFNARNIHRKSKQSIGYWMFVKFSIKFRSAHMHMHWEKSNDDDDGYNGDSEDETATESMCITNLKETKSYSRIPGKRCIEVKNNIPLMFVLYCANILAYRHAHLHLWAWCSSF